MTSMGKVSRRLARAHRHQRPTTTATCLAVDIGDDTVMVFGPATRDHEDLAERLESLSGHLRLLRPARWEGDSEHGRPFTDEVGNEVLVAGPSARDPFNAEAIADVLDDARARLRANASYAPFLEEAA